MQELLLILKETIGQMILSMKSGAAAKGHLLLADERQQLQQAIQTLRHDLVQGTSYHGPFYRPMVTYALESILALTRQLHAFQNEIFAGMLAGEPSTACQEMYEYELELTKLFAWILKTFAGEIPPGQPLPPLFRSENFKAMTAFVDKARKILVKRSIPVELINIVLRPFCIFTGRDRPIKYSEFKYVYFYKLALTRFLTECKFDQDRVCIFLHRRRNNSLPFLRWQTNAWQDDTRQLPKPGGELMYYHQRLKNLGQCVVRPGEYFSNGEGSVEMLRNWLEAEVEFIKQAQFCGPGGSIKQNNAEIEPKAEKMVTALTVADLACFFRLMFDSKLLGVDTPAEVIRFVCRTFSTAFTENIAEPSFHNKFYTIERSTLAKVKSQLIKLLNTLRDFESGENTKLA